jgi:hypothetical protein
MAHVIPEWNTLSESEKLEIINPYLDLLKARMLKAKGIEMSTNTEWYDGQFLKEIAAESITFEMRRM